MNLNFLTLRAGPSFSMMPSATPPENSGGEKPQKQLPPQPEHPRSISAIAARLTAARLALRLTPAELCRKAKIAPNTYSQWESAKGRPQLDEAIKLADKLGYSLDWIYLGHAATLPHSLVMALADLPDRIEEAAKTTHRRRGRPRKST